MPVPHPGAGAPTSGRSRPTQHAPMDLSAASAARLDADDPLAPFRSEFYLPPGKIYLDGNSLGLLSRRAEESLLRAVAAWRYQAIEGWLEAQPPWLGLAEALGGLTAPLVGARPDAVIVTNSTTVNLHQLLGTLFQPQPGRDRILVDALAFPSDVHAVVSHLCLRGLDPERCLARVPSRADGLLDEAALIRAMEGGVAVAVLPTVVYTTGQLLDVKRLARAARNRGILIGLDCSHSVGAVPHRLEAWEVDFAFWCGYKYLNGGPGAAAGLFLHPRHWGRRPGLAGWFGSDKRRQFEMSHRQTPAAHAGALQIGTPNVLSMAPLLGGLEQIAEAGLERLRRKSLQMTAYLRAWAEATLAPAGVEVVTPREPDRRGGHVALAHPDARRLCRALRDGGVVPDFRPPNLIRLAPAPLYNTFSECREAMIRLEAIVRSGRYLGLETEHENQP